MKTLLNVSEALGGSLLAIDTSGPQASICRVAWGDPKSIVETLLPSGVMPSDVLVQALADAARETSLDWRALKAVVVGIGPGSFTGLRVGLAAIKGLAFGAQLNVLKGVSSLAMWAASAGEGLVATVLDARRDEIFGAVHRVNAEGLVQMVVPEAAYTPEDFVRLVPEPVRVIGDGSEIAMRTAELLKVAHENVPMRAAFGLVQAADDLRRGLFDDAALLLPRYLRVSEAERQLGINC